MSDAKYVLAPFARRDDLADDAALGALVLRNYGATPVDLLHRASTWDAVLDALHHDDDAVLPHGQQMARRPRQRIEVPHERRWPVDAHLAVLLVDQAL